MSAFILILRLLKRDAYISQKPIGFRSRNNLSAQQKINHEKVQDNCQEGNASFGGFIY